jgi:hypothetical protein
VNYYKPKHFKIQEFVPPEVYAALGEKASLVMDNRMLITADTIREYFGKPVTINDWVFGGERVLSGFRAAGCKIGAAYSQHKFGRAFDIIIKEIPAEVARKEILSNRDVFKYITAMESGVSWLHVDCRPITDGIVLFND